jgi:hypothetical protein
MRYAAQFTPDTCRGIIPGIMSSNLTEITSIAEAVYILVPVQWKISTKRDIQHPFLVCSEATYLNLCKHFNRQFNRVEATAFGNKYIVFEV